MGRRYDDAVHSRHSRLMRATGVVIGLCRDLKIAGEPKAATRLKGMADRLVELEAGAKTGENSWSAVYFAATALRDSIAAEKTSRPRPRGRPKETVPNVTGMWRQLSAAWRGFLVWALEAPNQFVANLIRTVQCMAAAGYAKDVAPRPDRRCLQCGYNLKGFPIYTCPNCNRRSGYDDVCHGLCPHCREAVSWPLLETLQRCPECGLPFYLHPPASYAYFDSALEKMDALISNLNDLLPPREEA